MQHYLHTQIGQNIEAYVDDVVIKSKKTEDLIWDLLGTFENFRRFDMKLNPTKCTFGVPSGKLLGYNISTQGTEANPTNIKAILDMWPIHGLKDTHKSLQDA